MRKNAKFSLFAFIALPALIFLAFQNCSPKGFSSSSIKLSSEAPLLAAPTNSLMLVSAVSRKQHAAATYDLVVNTARLITDNLISVEPRMDLGTGHTIIFKFDKGVSSVGTASVVNSENLKIADATAVVSSTDSKEVIVRVMKLPNQLRAKIIISGLNGTDQSSSVAIGFLAGDVNGSGVVETIDTELVNSLISQPISVNNFKSDINQNGIINVEDRENIRARLALGLIYKDAIRAAGVTCESILNYNSCAPPTAGAAALSSSNGQTELTCQTYCSDQIVARNASDGDYCCQYTPPQATANNQSVCALSTWSKVASSGIFPNSAAICSKRPGGALTCAATTRTIVSAVNNVGAMVSCDASLAASVSSATPVAATVTNGGSYSLVCQATGMWSTTPATAICPAPANVICPAISRTVVSAKNSLDYAQSCVFNLPATPASATAVAGVPATPVIVGSSYSLICNNDGTWAAAATTSVCPIPGFSVADIPIPAAKYLKLSDSLFSRMMDSSQNYINFKEYVPQYPLYSDNATKRRFIYLPNGQKVNTAAPDDWIYPMGTILYKEFSIDGKKIETRVWEKTAAAEGPASWRSSVYVWKVDQTDADLLTVDDFYTKPVTERQIYQAGQVEAKYKMVRNGQCVTCHKGSNDNVLGFNYLQLSKASLNFNIFKFNSMNYFSVPILVEDQIKGTQKARDAMGYMQSNCATCHSPRGNVNLPNYKHVSGTLLYEGETIITTNNARVSPQLPLITFGDLTNSLIYQRLNNRTMPGILPIAVDQSGVKLLSDWILEPPLVAVMASVNCLSTTRTIVSAPNSSGATQSCVATMPGASPSGIAVQASSVTNGGSYSLICTSTGGAWATTASVSLCPQVPDQAVTISMETGGIGVSNDYIQAQSFSFNVLASSAPSSDLVIPLVPGKAGDTALNNIDYTIPATVTIRAGTKTASFQMIIIKDQADEVYPAPVSGNTYSFKSFFVGLQSAANSEYALGFAKEFNVGVWKTAVAPLVSDQAITISMETGGIGVSNDYLQAQSFSFNVLASSAPLNDLVVSLVPGKAGDTALNNIDYTIPSTVTIKAGTKTASFQIVIVKDLANEVYPAPTSGNTYSSKFFYVGLQGAANSEYALGAAKEFSVGIWKTAIAP